MSTKDQIFEVEKVIFETGDPLISVTGIMQQGFLKYPTELLVNSTQLNLILNQLQKNNSCVDIYHNFESVQLETDITLYRGLFGNLENKQLNLTSIDKIEAIKEIRA